MYVLHDKCNLGTLFLPFFPSSLCVCFFLLDFFLLYLRFNNNNKPVSQPSQKYILYHRPGVYFQQNNQQKIKPNQSIRKVFGGEKTRPTCSASFHKLIFPFAILFKFSHSVWNSMKICGYREVLARLDWMCINLQLWMDMCVWNIRRSVSLHEMDVWILLFYFSVHIRIHITVDDDDEHQIGKNSEGYGGMCGAI